MSARAWAAFAAMCAPIVFGACDVGQDPDTGVAEPIVVQGAQFIPGDLPGSPPVARGTMAPATPDGGLAQLSVVSLGVGNPDVQAGASLSVKGDVSGDTAAVGIRLLDMGTGYWVVPAGAPDPQTPGALGYSFSTGYSLDDAPGAHTLRVVAIGSDGNAGTQADLGICLESRIPDNGHACAPDVAPPAAVFTLTWDTSFDLDMHIVAPGGLVYDSKTLLAVPLEAGATSIPPDQPFIDRDSMRNCVPDGLHQEDLVFPTSLPKGPYYIFVNPYSACGQNAVHFTFTVYKSAGKCPACNLQPTLKQSGELLASQATDGLSPPTYIDQLVVQ
jgi:hypothetical protein